MSKGGSDQLDSQDRRGKPVEKLVAIGSREEKKKRKYQHPLSLPATTKWGSDEEITLDQQITGTGGCASDEHQDAKSDMSAEDRDKKLKSNNLGRHERHNIRVTGQARPGRLDDLSRDIVVTQEWKVSSKY
ncbi:uncharacterized protein N0V89_004409 [Didymosphaeria variabile]|uniref:Uncharacterized protein n=1 Tax=Didymosphaeria variabile TaxID=1932322 RepID=A0A9W8XRT4_9PLEO|nr:uncharacterized protein N0V89_004409 [Didymosphaeria variabile]KAJ4356376.1 hypothetical protein N0V89_004409 [Didymosphaeria variabile]